MDKIQLITKIKNNKIILREFVQGFHPCSRNPASRLGYSITAPVAENACKIIRTKIVNEEPKNPIVRFDKAIEEDDLVTLNTLLNDAWFGVPETKSCWQIPGFTLAVDLIEDYQELESEDDINSKS